MDKKTRNWLIAGITAATLLIAGLIIRYVFFTFVDSYEVGYNFNEQTGELTVLNRSGYHRITPFVNEIHTIDLRPMQIRVEANNRVLNAMLVRFKKEGVQQFVELHGRQDYSTDDHNDKLKDILMSYAYEGYGSDSYNKEALQKKYKFLEILGNTSGGSQVNSKDSTNEKK